MVDKHDLHESNIPSHVFHIDCRVPVFLGIPSSLQQIRDIFTNHIDELAEELGIVIDKVTTDGNLIQLTVHSNLDQIRKLDEQRSQSLLMASEECKGEEICAECTL